MTKAAEWPWSGGLLGQRRQILATDILAVAIAVSLPWSTSATEILVWVWLFTAIPTIRRGEFREMAMTAVGGLPVLLFLLGVIGMLWAYDVPMSERLGGLKSFYKLLFIPPLIIHFRQSERGAWVVYGFVASCGALLMLAGLTMIPGFPWHGRQGPGTPMKDYIAQSGEFIACIFLLAPVALSTWRQRLFAPLIAVIALCVALAAGIMFPSSISRTGLVVAPILLVIFLFKYLNGRHALILFAVIAVLGGAAASFAPSVRNNVKGLVTEVVDFSPEGKRTRAGERLEYWRKSIGFFASAPIIGHGTGSIHDQFRRSVDGEVGMAALAAENPHNQTLALAIQFGLVGVVALWAMWIAHLLFFRGEGYAAWAGTMFVVQNIIGSLFNSHLSDFTQGWGYVIGVGVAAGIVLKRQPLDPAANPN
jgi:O-antigen ligase